MILFIVIVALAIVLGIMFGGVGGGIGCALVASGVYGLAKVGVVK